MKIKLFDETILNADIIEKEDEVQLTIQLERLSEYSKIFESLTDSNLSNVTITFDDGTHSDYKNLKFASADLKNKSGTYWVVILLSSKTAYELTVDSLTEEVSKYKMELTKTQMAIAEIYETIDLNKK